MPTPTDKEKLKESNRRNKHLLVFLALQTAIVILLCIITQQLINTTKKLTEQNKTLKTHLAKGTYEEYAKQEVYRVCNQSRISPSVTEAECAELQDKYNMRFICEERNAQPDNICWVETK